VNGNVRTIACDSSGNIVVGTDAGVFLTKDVGKSWVSINTGLPAEDSVLRQICYSTEGFWLAATAFGVFTLTEGDTIWQSNSDGLDDPDILCIDVGGPGKYYVGTTLAGVYTTEAAQSSVSRASSQLSNISVEAYPNPSSRSLTLTFDLAQAGFVDARLFDQNGREVSNLISEELQTGQHSFSVDHSSIPAGQYFIRVLTKDELVLPVVFR
jgi:hypothetical protein